MSFNRSSAILDAYNYILDTITIYLSTQPLSQQQVDKAIIFNDAKKALASILSQHTNVKQNNLSYLELTDILISINEINAIFEELTNNPDSPNWKDAIVAFLKRRAERILNSPLCYTVNRPYAMNDICISLARLCDPDSVCTLLMPSVISEDIYGNELNNLSIGQFILSDDKKTFISISDIIDTAFTRSLDSEAQIYLTTTASGESRPLSATEMRRLGTIHQSLENICNQFREKNFFSRLMDRNKDKLYKKLAALRNGLRAGDVHHGGEEMNAGAAANEAIVRFREYYESLSKTRQAQLRAYAGNGRTLGQIFDVIFRNPEEVDTNDGTSVIYCMYLVGDQLEYIITANKARLLNYNETKQECIERLKNKLLQDIQCKRYQNLDETAVRSLNLQLTQFMDTLKLVALSNSHHRTAADSLVCMANFIATECRRYLTTNDLGDKLNYFTDLLFAIGNELNSLNKRTSADTALVVKETFRRITHLVSCPTTFISFSQPTSKTNWRKWLDNNPILHYLIFNQENERETKSLNIYLLHYPANTHRTISSEAIVNLRARETHEIELVKQDIEREKRIKEMRANSPLSFFYNNPTATGIAATAVAAASAALITYRLIS